MKNEDSKLRKSIIALNRNSAGKSFQAYIYLSRTSVHLFMYLFILSKAFVSTLSIMLDTGIYQWACKKYHSLITQMCINIYEMFSKKLASVA